MQTSQEASPSGEMNWPPFRTPTSSVFGEVALEDALIHLVKECRLGQLTVASPGTIYIVTQ